MPRHSTASRVLFPLAFLAWLCSTGCTATGFTLGAMVDVDRGKGPARRLEGVHHGTDVTIWLRDGSQINGRFRGFDPAEAAVDPPSASGSSPAPPAQTVLLETKHETRKIPVADVERVSVPVYSGKVVGLLIGAALDVAIVAAAAVAAGNIYH